MKLIKRTSYLEQLKSTIGTPDIKIITGIRRSGKSKLMEAFINEVESLNPTADIIHINFNSSVYETLKEYHALLYYIETRCRSNSDNFLFIDEVQC